MPAYVTPTDIAPFPKAEPRKANRGVRKKGSTRILTDTPVRNEIAAIASVRQIAQEKKQQKIIDKAQRDAAKQPVSGKNIFFKSGKKRCSVLSESSDSSSDHSNLQLKDHADDESDVESDDEIIPKLMDRKLVITSL